MQSGEEQVAAASQADATREDVVVDVGAEETQIGKHFYIAKAAKEKDPVVRFQTVFDNPVVHVMKMSSS